MTTRSLAIIVGSACGGWLFVEASAGRVSWWLVVLIGAWVVLTAAASV